MGNININGLGNGKLYSDILKKLNFSLKDKSVTTQKLADGSVNVSKLADNSVINAKLHSSIQEALASAGIHQSNTSNPHNVTAAQVGLGNVTNDAQVKRAEMGSALGVATLGLDGKVLRSQLPSYIESVLEFTDITLFPSEGDVSTIYIDLSTKKKYKWGGSEYNEVTVNLALGETSETAYAGDKGKIAYDHSQSAHARTDATKVESSETNGNIKIDGTETTVYTHPTGTNPHSTTASDVGLGDVVNTGDSAIPVDGGTTKFTTGGAYTELAKKLDKTVSITWSALKALRDGSNLVPGQLYRITDYVTTTVQEGSRSVGHQFDIIVIADDLNILSEDARACLHSGDTYFSSNGAKLEAWQLKYRLDNDTTNFKWADATNGKGVIYRMIDEWDNSLPYDFKNIQFYRDPAQELPNIPSGSATTTLGAIAWNGLSGDDSGTYLTASDKYYYTFTYISKTNEVKDASLNLKEYMKEGYNVTNKLVYENYFGIGLDNVSSSVGAYYYNNKLTNNVFCLNEKGTDNCRIIGKNNFSELTESTWGGRNVYENIFTCGYCNGIVVSDAERHSRFHNSGVINNIGFLKAFDRISNSGYIVNSKFQKITDTQISGEIINCKFSEDIVRCYISGCLSESNIYGRINYSTISGGFINTNVYTHQNFCTVSGFFENCTIGRSDGMLTSFNCHFKGMYQYVDITYTTIQSSNQILNYTFSGYILGTESSHKTIIVNLNSYSSRIVDVDSNGNAVEYCITETLSGIDTILNNILS